MDTPPEKPNLLLVGALYGLAWGCVALGVILLITGGDFRGVLSSISFYLLGSIPTGIAVTWLFKALLPRARPWGVVAYGFLALLAGTLIFATCMLVIFSGYNFFQNLAYHEYNVVESFLKIRTHDSLIMFIWYPFYAFACIFPIFLAILNCWDLRRRLAVTGAAA